MKHIFAALLIAAVAGAVTAGVVLAQLGDTQTASGSINATTTSADLYICEPDSTPGPACGSDDSGADETVFEALENLLPGDVVEYDVRLQNIGTTVWALSEILVGISEVADSGDDCPNSVLTIGQGRAGIGVLGKAGDPQNDNPGGLVGFLGYNEVGGGAQRVIKVVAGDYEDIRLQLQMSGNNAEGCDGNEWDVSWDFTVLPIN